MNSINNNFLFKLEDFEGPLDLLVELFKTNKLEIISVNIEQIINQYILIIDNLEETQYDYAIEYLEFAAELVLYKSKKILNKDEEIEDCEEEEFDDLLDRILEYKKFKEASKEIKELKEQRNYLLTREESDLKEFYKSNLESIEFEKFLLITKNLWQKIENSKTENKEIHIFKELNIQEYIEKLLNLETIDFLKITKDIPKFELITIFLAILEILKKPGITYSIFSDNIIIKV